MRFSRLSSSRMVVPLPSSRCLAEGNRISLSTPAGILHHLQFHLRPSHSLKQSRGRRESRSREELVKATDKGFEAVWADGSSHLSQWTTALQSLGRIGEGEKRFAHGGGRPSPLNEVGLGKGRR